MPYREHPALRLYHKQFHFRLRPFLEKIFERFEKLDSFAQGAGLGLSICKLIVEKMNGRVLVDSQLGIGTTFVIELPCRSMLVE